MKDRPRVIFLLGILLAITPGSSAGQSPTEPTFIAKPGAFTTLVNPACSHCRDEARRRAGELKDNDRVLCWLRGYSDGGAIPVRFFLGPYRVISDSYGVFVYDPDAGFARGFSPSYEFRFHGWRNGVMVMRHQDGTLYSCLTGVAFDGPGKGNRLKPIPTLMSDWKFWLERYPGAVAYHMFDKYQPLDPPAENNPNSLKSRGKADPRLGADALVLGVHTVRSDRAYPIKALEEKGLVEDQVGDVPVVVFWEPRTRTASAFKPLASQPRKYLGPRPDTHGVSPLDGGVLVPSNTPVQESRSLTLKLATKQTEGPFMDAETHSVWDVAGRCVAGKLKGWTLEWVDSVEVKWFAWAAEYPRTTVYPAKDMVRAGRPSVGIGGTVRRPSHNDGGRPSHNDVAADPNKKAREIAGTAEFLRLLPKPFATLKAVDPRNRTVTLLIEGEKVAKVWPVEPDAEVKIHGWWGRLEQFHPDQRVWAWLKLDRKMHPFAVAMLGDEMTEFDTHGGTRDKQAEKPSFTPTNVEAKRSAQKAWLRKRWAQDGLPGTLIFHHVFSGELEIALDHEAMRWGRSLGTGDEVSLTADPPIKGMVKTVAPWRDRTIVRLVVGELESSELKIGQRLGLKMTPPSKSVENSIYPPDVDQPRSKSERVEWFLASVYCTCGVGKDTCTGDFYTLASCNPNGCGMPNHTRGVITKMIDRGLNDRQILDELMKQSGPLLLRPHLRP